MLACLAPIALAYTFITARSTTQIFSDDLKAETRVAQRALNASLTPDIQQGEWDEISSILSAIGRADLIAAVLDERGKIRFALNDFPIAPPPREWIAAQIAAHGAAEYMQAGAVLDDHKYGSVRYHGASGGKRTVREVERASGGIDDRRAAF